MAAPLDQVNMQIETVIQNELDGYPVPVSCDPVVTLQEAIDRCAVTATKGLPSSVVWRLKNPELARTHHFFEFKSQSLGMWPAPSRDVLTDSITALAGVQRRLMIGGVLPCRGDKADARSAS